jgi:pyridoxamine 5'-phosphate oxidase
MQNLADLRKTYAKGSLAESDVNTDPIKQFEIWFEQASQAQCPEPHAMTLATVDEKGFPSARIVLLKGVIDHQFVFYTNYQSQKGQSIASNSRVALLFFWHELERQVRIEGECSFLNPELSDAYYQSRPIESRIGAWASPQSKIVPHRNFLEEEETKYHQQFGKQPPRPPHWGGYKVNPTRIEFWQGRPSRLHDRINFTLENDSWVIHRLAP